MPVASILPEIASRCRRIRAGLDVGFGDPAVSDRLRNFRGGVWMSIPSMREFPFEDAQFDIVVAAGTAVNRELAREANRVLRADGFLFFTVNERTRKQEGVTPAEIYRVIREGFDIISIRRPQWWHFGRMGRTLTVCARKKAWHEHKDFLREGSLPFTPFRRRTS